jgi:hypothetical protein
MTPPADLVPVPSVEDLVLRKLARPVGLNGKGGGTHYLISPAGQLEIFRAMARNAAAQRERAGWISCDRCERTDPHSHGRPLPSPADLRTAG